MKFLRKAMWVILMTELLLLTHRCAAEPIKNVIVMISDGCGYNQIRATDYYWGATQSYENFPVRVAMSTYSWTTLQEDPMGYDPSQMWSDFLYGFLRPTDSAAAATAMSTGVKTWDDEVNLDPVDGHRLPTVTERAKQLGKSAGIVTTVEWCHGTPAGFAAHNVSRTNYEEIAVEMLDSCNLDVIMGAGHPNYTDNHTLSGTADYGFVGGQVKWNQLLGGTTPLGWTLIQSRPEFLALQSGPTPSRVCGTIQCATTAQQARVPAEGANSPVVPYTVPRNDVPTLAEMSRGALNVLDNNPSGFFLMIEGGAIDWAGHANQHGRLIEEETDFNQAVSAVIEWVEANSNWSETLLIVTGDHETGYLWGLGSGWPASFIPLTDNGPGRLPGMVFNSDYHTNQLIPLFAKGEGSQWFEDRAIRTDPVRGRYMDNTDIAHVIFGYYDHVLAVELQSFEAVALNEAVTLSWVTASENDNARFEIVRDGETVAAVDGQRNSATEHRYSWTDHGATAGNDYDYSLFAVSLAGERQELGQRSVSVRMNERAAIRDYALYQNYPNPFNPSTTIAYDLPADGAVTICIFNSTGQRVATLVDGDCSAGHHAVTFDASGLSSGVYFCRLVSPEYASSRKMLLMK